MLLLLHGVATNASRSKLLNIRQKFDQSNVLVFEKSADVQSILASIATPSLLSNEQLIILENPPEDLELSLVSSNLSLVIWFDKELSEKSKMLQFIKENKGEIFYFPPEKELTIFPFLDLLANRNPKAFLELKNLQKTHEKFSDNQYLFTMVFYLLRSLITTPKTAPSFVKQKLEKQRKNFTQEELVNLYRFILETDYKIKSGLIENPQAQFLIVNKFK